MMIINNAILSPKAWYLTHFPYDHHRQDHHVIMIAMTMMGTIINIYEDYSGFVDFNCTKKRVGS